MDIKPPARPRSSAAPKAADELPVPLLPGAAAPLKPDAPAPEEPPKRPRKRILWWLLAAFAIIAVVLGSVAGWYFYNLTPVDAKDESRHQITLQSGVTAGEIAGTLHQNGLIRDETVFRTYVELQGARARLQAGTYKFSKSQTVAQIVDDLVNGKTDAYNVTILPGHTLAEIKETLELAGFTGKDIDAAFAKQYDHPLLSSKPAGINLEGYIYPETYQIDGATTVESLLLRSFDEFQSVLEEHDLPRKLTERGLSIHSAVTLASIVQKEVSNTADMSKVAQVFLKRLSIGMELGSDVTFQYAAELMGVPESVNLDSPYNTRRYTGLPPGAISNFNLSALQAVAEPAPTDYLYFVAGDDGTTHFSHTLEEHEANTKKYCTDACQ